ncbi:unnamed protein product [Rotaria sordida]|nr:unnamed protein product [Rotaria sordida]CAF1224687.1 unnamed protein product [Rotaria sordida]CAF3722618.1 unnamed protein product [Rotaria sordida]CAF3800791.1 unnamed protein product [Rotaria sordida]
MAELTKKIEIRFNESLSKLNADFRQFLLNCLFEYHYDYEQSQFKEILTINRLDPFLNDLQATRDALDAFRAAWTGNKQLVEIFLENYPTFKDKPGPWSTTLLYSAARNNQMAVVKYLLSEIHCSVNAQNRQHIQRALRMDTITASDYKVDPSAGSNALHGACYGGHLEIVKYLIDHDANCFMRNQAEETPMMNAIRWPHIIQYFQDLLNRGYIEEQQHLPESPITVMDKKQRKDCIWEFLSFSFYETWLPFDTSEVKQLNELMTVKDGKQFQTEYQWNISQTISMVRFLQSGDTIAWVRCRGSSILNFDCFALWQIFYLKHPNGKYDEDDLMPMKILDLSLLDEREPKIQLNTWYNCDATSNDRLDEAMNNRRKHTTFSLVDRPVQFDLMNFTFTNEDQSISGFIRWIPKLVSNNDQSKHRIVPINNFQASSNVNPVPLTTEHRKEASQSTSNQRTFDSDDDEVPIDVDIVTDDKQPETTENSEDESELSEDPIPLPPDAFDDGIEDDRINQKTSEQLARAETSTSSEGSDELRQKIAELEKALQIERSKIQTQCDAMEQQHAMKQEEAAQTIQTTLEEIERLTAELNPLKQRKETVQKMKQKIQITEYDKIARERQRHDQILCFVNSVTEVTQCCRILEQLTQGTIKGYPLIQAQSAPVQRSYIEHGSVFFSTTVAETSLTFPSLKYVVDTGMINVPVYDPQTKRTVMRQVRAAESTIKQRLGRLGRTQDGEYYALYDFRVEDQRFPTPQICQLDLTNLEFILRRSLIRRGLHYMQQFLPDKPKPAALDATVEELFRLS